MSKHAGLVVDEKTALQQAKASDPSLSAWVSANAGSGKTYVLSRRVVRLLLAGTDPSRILCLTFTKAAAGEMSNRVFELLAKWTTLPESKLSQELQALTGQMPDAAILAQARRLFARALETPGGLKVQTIHAFCEALLHRFPLEANVPGAFSVISEQADIMEAAQNGLLASIERDRNGPLADAYRWIAARESDNAIERLFSSIIKHRNAIETWLDHAGGIDAAMLPLRNHILGENSEESLDALFHASAISDQFDDETLRSMAQVAAAEPVGKTGKLNQNTQRFLNRLNPVLDARNDEEKSAALSEFVVRDGKARQLSPFTGPAVKEHCPDLNERIEAEAERQIALQERIKLHLTLERTRHAMVLAQDLLARFRHAKREIAGLDYDDLIARTAALLTRRDARQWVLFKLDAGLDHILVDEAQDTSPAQWEIISALAEEFFAGEGSAQGRNRTVFAVGDDKQSIYSFQGARPELFDETRRAFSKQAASIEGKELEAVELTLSFRSTEDVLKAVDAVFGQPNAYDGLSTIQGSPTHGAARKGQAGEVEIWSLAQGAKGKAPDDWAVPVDQSATRHQADLLAERMVARMAHWFKSGERITATGKPITPGDILVLVRSRDRFVRALTRGLKDADIPVAGSDRLTLTDDIAVQDLIALGRVMVNVQDDLSLAALLKSPLFGLSDDDVQKIALDRLQSDPPRSVYDQLRLSHTKIASTLDKWRGLAGTVPVHEFYAQILGAEGGRQAFYARLSREVQDVLDAFMDQTLACEREVQPGLQAFLERLELHPPQIKRELDTRSDAVRIMTVHAAKGLEAPVVFLVDQSKPVHQANRADALFEIGPVPGYLWVPTKKDHAGQTAEALKALVKRDEDEHRRLLYVGMTRAEDRLVVAGYRSSKEVPANSWHNLVSAALLADAQEIYREDHVEGEAPFTIHRWRSSPMDGSQTAVQDIEDKPVGGSSQLPLWARHRMKREPDVPRPLSPSGAQYIIDDAAPDPPSGKAASVKMDSAKASALSSRRRGNVMHLLLQWLVQQEDGLRDKLARDYLKTALPELSAQEQDTLVAQVLKTMRDPQLAPFFNPNTSNAEVPVSGVLDLGKGQHPVIGTIDRLAVLDDEVWMLDYKTGRSVPQKAGDIPAVYILQMALYRNLLRLIYPQHKGRAALIYTAAPEGPRLLELDDAAMDCAINELHNTLAAA